ncbi:hypothetical protein DID75_04800 [Candidatus Marinamargulisbacteria bacterium SCGC AG-410-N11]|nr:hypothetical protein DID75_04800 [Candidatus Marinamargulisbacteria bacterium SCGC AG-410-N11]
MFNTNLNARNITNKFTLLISVLCIFYAVLFHVQNLFEFRNASLLLVVVFCFALLLNYIKFSLLSNLVILNSVYLFIIYLSYFTGSGAYFQLGIISMATFSFIVFEMRKGWLMALNCLIACALFISIEFLPLFQVKRLLISDEYLLWIKVSMIIGVFLSLLAAIYSFYTLHTDQNQKLTQSLREKDILLKEIHHRVKNNLHLVISLFDFQEDLNTDSYSEMKDRIKSIALIHQNLYESNNLSSINMNAYIHRLIKTIFDSFGSQSTLVKKEIHDSTVDLSIDTALTCGLIINEMISNSLKYAFPSMLDRTPEIYVSLQKRSDNKKELIVSDNGVGCPFSLDDYDGSTLGVQLIKDLTLKLDGEIKISQEKGLKYHITFESD